MKATKIATVFLCTKPTSNLFLLLLFSLFFTSLSAQGIGNFDLESGIVLQTDRAELPYSFEIKLSDQMKSADLKDYFKAFNTTLTTLEFDQQKQTITISVEKRMKPAWTIEKWNNFLLKLHKEAISNPKK